MEEQNFFKVLWVEDEEENVESTQSRARRNGLKLIWTSNWDDAKEKLKTNFEEYSAIIFDANCKIHQNSLEEERFIPAILPNLTEIFTRKQKCIPWYILSAGTMGKFDFVMDVAGISRDDYTDEWGDMLYLKYAKDDDPHNVEFLFRKIREIAEKKFHNDVLCRHKDVFDLLGEEKLIHFPQARRYMLEMLSALYYPEYNLEYKYEGNLLRKVLECVFWTAREKGLIPEDCINVRNNKEILALNNACKFMTGRTIIFSENDQILYKLRWGKAGAGKDGNGKGCERIFDRDTSTYLNNLMEYTNADSHISGGEDEEVKKKYIINEDKKEVFFGYVMHLCYIIQQFGKYVMKHSDIEKNKEKHCYTDCMNLTPEDVIGNKFLALNTGDFYRAGRCKLSPECGSLSGIVGKDIIIDEVVENTDRDKWSFPFKATKITIVA